MKPITQLTIGFAHIWDGIRLLRNNRPLRKWAVIPFLLDFFILVLGFGLGFSAIGGWVAGALHFIGLTGGGFLIGALSFVLSLLFWVAYTIVLIYATFLLASVVAAPFNSLLAERTLIHLGVLQPRPFKLGEWILISLKMLFVAMIKALVFLFLGVIIFICAFIPGLNFASSFGAFLIMAFDSMDYSFEMREFTLRRRIRYFQNHFVEFSGMGLSLGVTLFIPGLTLLFLPASVVGAAIVMNKIEKVKS